MARDLRRIAFAFALLAPSSAFAAPSEADRLFAEGDALLTAGKAADACPKLEKSEAVDPAAGTELRLAECYEAIGRYRDASKRYLDLEATMRKVGDEAQAIKLADRAAAAEAKIAKVVVRAAWAVPGDVTSVTIDGVATADAVRTEVAVDPGSHEVKIDTRDHRTAVASFVVGAGERTTIDVPEPAKSDAPTRDAAAPVAGPAPPPEAHDGGARRGVGIAGLVVGGVGVAALGVGVVLGVVAKGAYDTARMNGGCATGGECAPGTQSHVAGAETTALVGTIVGGVGVAGIVGGGILFLTAPSGSTTTAGPPLRLTPYLKGREGGLAAVGRF